MENWPKQSSAPPLNKVESLAIDSIAGTTVSGIPAESTLQSPEVSRSSRSLATSGGLITLSSMFLNDIDKDSEISFDFNSNHGSSTPIPSPDTSQHSLQPIQNPFSQPATPPSSQQSSQPSTQPSPQPSSQLLTPPTMQSSSRTPLRATTCSIRSSRTVTRDVKFWDPQHGYRRPGRPHLTFLDMLKKDTSLSCVGEIRSAMLDRDVWRGIVAARTKKPT